MWIWTDFKQNFAHVFHASSVICWNLWLFFVQSLCYYVHDYLLPFWCILVAFVIVHFVFHIMLFFFCGWTVFFMVQDSFCCNSFRPFMFSDTRESLIIINSLFNSTTVFTGERWWYKAVPRVRFSIVWQEFQINTTKTTTTGTFSC
jgi:hypothetical protein